MQSCTLQVVLPSLCHNYLALTQLVTILLAPEASSRLRTELTTGSRQEFHNPVRCDMCVYIRVDDPMDYDVLYWYMWRCGLRELVCVSVLCVCVCWVDVTCMCLLGWHLVSLHVYMYPSMYYFLSMYLCYCFCYIVRIKLLFPFPLFPLRLTLLHWACILKLMIVDAVSWRLAQVQRAMRQWRYRSTHLPQRWPTYYQREWICFPLWMKIFVPYESKRFLSWLALWLFAYSCIVV